MRIVINDGRREDLRHWLDQNGDCPDWLTIHNCSGFIYLLHYTSNANIDAIALNNPNTICIAANGYGIKVGKREAPDLGSAISAEYHQGPSVNGMPLVVDCLDSITIICHENLQELSNLTNNIRRIVRDTIVNYSDSNLVDDNNMNSWYPYRCNHPNIIQGLFF